MHKTDKKWRVPGRVWYAGSRWNVVEMYKPTEYDTYLVLQRRVENEIHEDGTTPIEMLMIDINNDTFQRDNKKVRKIQEKLKNLKGQEAALEDELRTEWLKAVK